MKKTIKAIALCLILLGTSVPVYATESGDTVQNQETTKCIHNNCTNNAVSSGGYCEVCNFNATYISNGNGIDHTTEWNCTGCGEIGVYPKEECSFVGGLCGFCRQAQQYTVCVHEKCQNPVTSNATCDDCPNMNWNPVVGRYIDENTHHEEVICGTCHSIYESGIKSHIISSINGKCVCGYTGNTSSVPTTSINTTDSGYQEPQEEPQRILPEVKRCKVKTADGNVIQSSTTSVFEAGNVTGAAVVSTLQDVKASLGIVDNGANASYYVCDNWNRDMRKHLEIIADENGMVIDRVISSDLYTISKEGKIDKIHSSQQPITVRFGLHGGLQNKEVSILAYNNATGGYAIYPDKDSDPTTITIEATTFGVYAFVTAK